ncbi:hypothetical protein ANACOL_04014 [Anaerotruncus colihominis DSM 17241]|uniref:Uncharacterized protein n=1 Tax=Anaerotruncus colihominis DSM 17241 TaxID=445972 RepID=B0PGZ3_9FIRM|nr:hypothetical protein ANACOL_04014 [Anaerotruncus colihominis DSM 17241]OUO67192.1 hypothetical protein B5F55_09650 [Anaerotruncus colihominis]
MNAAPACHSRLGRLKFFAELFSKRPEQNPRQPCGVCYGFCWLAWLLLNKVPCGLRPRFL